MPLSLQEFKKQNPAYSNWTDAELANGLYQKFYSDMDFKDFSDQVQYKPETSTPLPPSPPATEVDAIPGAAQAVQPPQADDINLQPFSPQKTESFGFISDPSAGFDPKKPEVDLGPSFQKEVTQATILDAIRLVGNFGLALPTIATKLLLAPIIGPPGAGEGTFAERVSMWFDAVDEVIASNEGLAPQSVGGKKLLENVQKGFGIIFKPAEIQADHAFPPEQFPNANKIAKEIYIGIQSMLMGAVINATTGKVKSFFKGKAKVNVKQTVQKGKQALQQLDNLEKQVKVKGDIATSEKTFFSDEIRKGFGETRPDISLEITAKKPVEPKLPEKAKSASAAILDLGGFSGEGKFATEIRKVVGRKESGRNLIRKTGLDPDTMQTRLKERGFKAGDTIAELEEFLSQELKNVFPEGQEKLPSSKRTEIPTEKINESELNVGQEFTIKGEKFKVESRTKDGVILQDGKTIDLEDFESIDIDAGSLTKGKLEMKFPEKKGAQAIEKEPFEMTTKELFDTFERKKTEEANLDKQILGDDLNAFNKAQRQLNSLDDLIVKKGEDTIDRIEKKLSKEDIDKLYGVGFKGRSAEELQPFVDSVSGLDIATSAKELGESLKIAITEVGEGVPKTETQKIAFTQLSHGLEIAKEKGFDLKEVSEAAIKASAKRFADPSDAAFMLERFKKAKELPKVEEVKPAEKLPVVEKELGSEVEAAIGEISPFSEVGAVKIPTKKKPLVSKVPFPDPKTEARFMLSKGVTKPPLKEQIKNTWQILKNKASREFEHLPKTAELAPLRNDLLRLSKQRGISTDRAIRAIQGITIDLDANTFDLFTRKVILDDLATVVKRDQKLPLGFTKESLPKAISKIDAAIKESPAIQKAMSNREKLWDALKNDYKKAMKSIGANVDKKLSNENYFRHQVLEYANLKGTFGAGKKLSTPTGRGFLKKRRGSELDINTDYIQVEFEVISQMMTDIEIAKTIKNIDKNYNIAETLKAEAVSKKIEDWRGLIPEGFTEWQPREGNVFYMADSIPAKLAEQLMQDSVLKLEISKSDLKKVLARGGKYKAMVVKDEIAETLNNLEKGQPLDLIPMASKKVMRAWKQWQLTSPRRFFKYNLRNMTGDADAVFLGNPSGFKKSWQATKELYDVFVGDKPMTENMKDWFERGGMQTTLQAQELGELQGMRKFQRFFEKKGTLTTRVWNKYWRTTRVATDFREAILRYANYLDYLDQMKNNPRFGGRPNNFGASIPEEIMGLSDIKDRAFWLSNELLGAYDRVGVLGQNIREHWVPFWSWKEVNFKRYNQLWRNLSADERLPGAVARKALGTGVKTAYRAFRVGKFLLKATALWTTMQAWNHLKYPDLEDSLSPEEQARPHIIFGKDKDGNIISFNRIGALGDYLAWFGLDAAPKHVSDWFSGRRTLIEIGKDMAKSPINVIWQGAIPLTKLLISMITSKNTFPDVFRPSAVRDRYLGFFQSFGLGNEYKAIIGLPSEGFTESLSKLFIYKSDPLQTGYYNNMDSKIRFKKKIGKSSEGFILSLRGQAIFNMKMAIRYEDRKAAEEYFAEYIKLIALSESDPKKVAEKSRQGVLASLERMKPLSGLTKSEQGKYVAQLDSRGKDDLEKAIQFYARIIVKGEKLGFRKPPPKSRTLKGFEAGISGKFSQFGKTEAPSPTEIKTKQAIEKERRSIRIKAIRAKTLKKVTIEVTEEEAKEEIGSIVKFVNTLKSFLKDLL